MQKITNFLAKVSFYWSITTLVGGFVVSCFWTGFKVRIAEVKLTLELFKRK